MACYNWDDGRQATSCSQRHVYVDRTRHHQPADADDVVRWRTYSDLTAVMAARQRQRARYSDVGDYIPVRSFSTSSRGVKNRGDSFKRTQTRAGTDVVGVGRARSGVSTSTSGAAAAAAELNVVVVGDVNVGKRSIISQFMTSEYMHGTSDNSPPASGEPTHPSTYLLYLVITRISTACPRKNAPP